MWVVAVAGSIALTLVVLPYVWLLGWLRRREMAPGQRPEDVPWWLGYARDGVNLGSLLALFAACRLAGYPGPVALVLGTALLLVTYSLDWLLGKALAWQGARWWVAAAASAAGIACMVWREAIGLVIERLMAAAAPTP